MRKAPMKLKKASPTKMKKGTAMKMKKASAMKKPLTPKQKKLPVALQKAILAAPTKMLKASAMKMMPKSAMKLVKKKDATKDHNRAARKTEGTRLRQALRRKFGKNKPSAMKMAPPKSKSKVASDRLKKKTLTMKKSLEKKKILNPVTKKPATKAEIQSMRRKTGSLPSQRAKRRK